MASLTPTASSNATPPEGFGRLPTRVFRWAARTASPGCARREVGEVLHQWGVGTEVCDNAALIVSELVTNVVLHTDGDTVVCRVRDGAERVCIEIGTEYPGRVRPSAHNARPSDERGRGLLVVDALSIAWGVRSDEPEYGWSVWAHLARTPRESTTA